MFELKGAPRSVFFLSQTFACVLSMADTVSLSRIANENRAFGTKYGDIKHANSKIQSNVVAFGTRRQRYSD